MYTLACVCENVCVCVCEMCAGWRCRQSSLPGTLFGPRPDISFPFGKIFEPLSEDEDLVGKRLTNQSNINCCSFNHNPVSQVPVTPLIEGMCKE